MEIEIVIPCQILWQVARLRFRPVGEVVEALANALRAGGLRVDRLRRHVHDRTLGQRLPAREHDDAVLHRSLNCHLPNFHSGVLELGLIVC